MFHIIWLILFIIKLYKSVANAPKLLASHYEKNALIFLRKLEKATITAVKREADVVYCQKRMLYNLTTVFLRFELYKTSLQNHRKSFNFRKSRLQTEIKQHQKEIKRLKRNILSISQQLKQIIGLSLG